MGGDALPVLFTPIHTYVSRYEVEVPIQPVIIFGFLFLKWHEKEKRDAPLRSCRHPTHSRVEVIFASRSMRYFPLMCTHTKESISHTEMKSVHELLVTFIHEFVHRPPSPASSSGRPRIIVNGASRLQPRTRRILSSHIWVSVPAPH